MARNYNKRENDLAIENAKLKQELIAATNDPNLLNQSNIINRKTRPDLYPDTNTNTNPENIPGEIIDPIQLTIPGLEGARNPLQISPQVAQRYIKKRFNTLDGTTEPFDKEGNDNYKPIKNPNPGQPFDWANQMRINNPQQIAELYLPGERGSTPGGLGNMNKDSLERWIKENGITGAGADKIRNKWKGLQGGINLPLAQAPYSPNPVKGPIDLRTPAQKIKIMDILYGPNTPKDRFKADAQGLTDLLSPFQNKKGSLKDSGLTKEEMLELLIRGIGVYKA